jgi:hypothetical protein
LVTAALDGFDEIENWYAAGGREQYGEVVHERLLKDLATPWRVCTRALAARLPVHQACFRAGHGRGDSASVEVALLDFEKCRQRLTAYRAASHDMLQLRRHSSWSARLGKTQLLLRDGVWQRYQGFNQMKLEIARGLFLVGALGVAAWPWRPGNNLACKCSVRCRAAGNACCHASPRRV